MTAVILPFPHNTSSSETDVENLLVDAFGHPDVEKRLKNIIEGAIMDVCLKSQLSDFERIDDPFDAIYISELQADKTNKYDTDRIMQYSKIVDLSSTISFDDGWEE